jgi:hypothetical protein
MSQSILKAAAGVAALAAIAFGASTIAGASGSGQSRAMDRFPIRGAGGVPGGANGAPPPGAVPGGPRSMGQPVTGATASKVKAAALARYPGTVEQVASIPGLGYIAHVILSGGRGELHVLVNKQFQVTGVMPGPGTPRPNGSSS